jgi:uncharacterized protein YggE
VATVTVRGAASVAATPDDASVLVELSDLRNTPEEAYASVAERSGELARLLDELEIERARRSTGGVSVRAESEYVDGRHQHRGYRATARTMLRLTDAALVARLLRDAVARVDARVEGPWWVVRPENPARLEAARAAALDARSRAEAYADALGVRLGALKRVQEPRRGMEPRSFDQRVFSAAAAEPAAVDVEPGEHHVSAAVDVTYVLEPA